MYEESTDRADEISSKLQKNTLWSHAIKNSSFTKSESFFIESTIFEQKLSLGINLYLSVTVKIKSINSHVTS